MKTICIFGDSTTWGAWDLEKGGWARRLRLYCDTEHRDECWVYALGIPGETTNDLLWRFRAEAQARQPTAVVFAIGANDAVWDDGKGAHWVDAERYGRNIKELVAEAKNFTGTVFLLGIQNVDESRTTPVAWAEKLHYKNETIRTYNDKLQAVAKEEKVTFIPVFSLLENDDLEDGLHPNAAGHQKIFERLKDVLEQAAALK